MERPLKYIHVYRYLLIPQAANVTDLHLALGKKAAAIGA